MQTLKSKAKMHAADSGGLQQTFPQTAKNSKGKKVQIFKASATGRSGSTSPATPRKFIGQQQQKQS
jgi:hypothetical protein